MIRTSDVLAVLTRNKIVLVVEDMLTKEYLLATWGSDQKYFDIIVAGGYSVVKGCVENFIRHGATHVFGLVDRDFGVTNKPRWNDPTNPPDILRCERHEIENYLLDWDALANCDINQKGPRHSAADITRWAKAEADKQVYWLACRKVLRDFQTKIGDKFPRERKLPKFNTLQEAEEYVANHAWTQTLQARAADVCDRTRLHTEIQAAADGYAAALINDSWRVDFSGKEIYRHLMSRLYSVPREENPTADIDLAISVAEWQLANNRVPAEVLDLRGALKQRVEI